ncbi:MAG: hypothetical protein JSR50_11550 [Proteobacteria bacterium]|nr:hypothetical protein [Pseudomonadota bacterium]
MATEIVTKASSGKERTFYSLNASYLISPGATREQLLDDANCLISPIRAQIAVLIDGLELGGGQMVANIGDVVSILYGMQRETEMLNNIIRAATIAKE